VLVVDGVLTASRIEAWLSGPGRTARDEWADLRPGHLLEDMERRLIERTLAKYNGHRLKTAQELGIGVRTLGMKLKRWREQGLPVDPARSSRCAIPA